MKQEPSSAKTSSVEKPFLSRRMSSSSLSSCSNSTATDHDATNDDNKSFPVCADEPNLYQIPPDLPPVYQPLPTWLVASLAASVIWSFRTFNQTTNGEWSMFVMMIALVEAVAIGVLLKSVLEEILVPPIRISTRDLIREYVLPSKFSKFESVKFKLPAADRKAHKSAVLGVHYQEYHQQKQRDQPSQFQSLYVNHGFGVSSLTWVPVLPILVERLRTQIGLGHDAVGFGFTDRASSDCLEAYTPTGSAAIGTALLQSKAPVVTNDKPVLLMGHSLGTLATLQMALSLPLETPKWVVLVAPAVGMRPYIGRQNHLLQWLIKGLLSGLSVVWKYALKRLVGAKNFWRLAVEVVMWADPKLVLDADVLRVQWPAIGLGWEDGLVKYALAMTTLPTTPTDQELVEQVVSLSNTVVTVVCGPHDKLVSGPFVRKFFAPHGDDIRIVEMEGLAHNPMEEDVGRFVGLLEQLWEEDKGRLI
ncbi:expressed unknown protein [Seminavis robusta]|uniref:AB hydrolase-1 domain-containing protein n=1 Tax=Seminavis robusta TaxID=568900 RepID=A0A9N8HCG0_9STRA|nr:expressed unknown protein [Seminavis robusta]|eukprot:Sro318_g115870.1 n/a (475) ;mRNA; r:15096-16599